MATAVPPVSNHHTQEAALQREGVILKVTVWSVRRNHGGFYPDTTKNHYDPAYTGQRFGRSFGRSFECECGEPMLDGDPFDQQLFDRTGRIVHANCSTQEN